MISEQPVELPGALMARARGGAAARAVIVGADQDVVLQSVQDAITDGLVTPVLVGDPPQISRIADTVGLSLTDIEILPASGDEAVARTGALRAASDCATSIASEPGSSTKTSFIPS